MDSGGVAAPSGEIGLSLVRNEHPLNPTLDEMVYHGFPRYDDPTLPTEVSLWRENNMPDLWRSLETVLLAKRLKIPTFYGLVWGRLTKGDGRVLDLGLMSAAVVTDAGVNFLVDAFQNLKELENFKYHGFGVGTTAEAAGDTALVTELTTEYAVNNIRPTGTQLEGASANIYRTVGALAPDSGGTLSITEHGIFDQAANSGGSLWDRSKFAVVSVVASADTLTITYDATFTSGG